MSEKSPILIVDDDIRMRELLLEVFSEQGFAVRTAADGDIAIQEIKENNFDLVITDLKMPKQDGLSIVKHAKDKDSEMPVIMITGHGTVDSAIEAMKQGAYDYIEKPFDPEQLILIVHRALRYYLLTKENRQMGNVLKEFQSNELIGNSSAIQKVKGMIAKIAALDDLVLIQGETGTGMELVARLIHRHSRRADKLFLPVNCGGIAENLLESELFGHEKGAFTGAGQQKKGLVELASNGTLFLDEINSMPTNFQAKILRFLQDQSFMRVGGSKELQANARIIAATNVNLADEVKAKRFRDDLYYRFRVMVLSLPPLRDHSDDIPELAYYFLRKYSGLYDKKLDKIDSHTLDLLSDHPWPGNVRELENVISSSVIMATSSTITKSCLPDEFRQPHVEVPQESSMNLNNMEQHLITKALDKTSGNKARAARLLGIDTSTLWRKLKRYNIQ